ncbi:MAG: RagB/SusD family nutrient uptake outer membrane protein [Bacteroidales bacterium]|nr:RagB/SusD family nutrient uptake outer membrane protein [Candidatus Cryptobacteroides aphodequi]
MKHSILAATLLLFAVSGCSFLDPDMDNEYTDDVIIRHPALAEGVLLSAYNNLPGVLYNQDAGTDNAVANNAASTFRLAATGSLNSSNNAYGTWKAAYESIAYTNHFICDIVDRVKWSSDEWKDAEYKKKLTAEARGLRAWYYMQLLEAHAGEGTSGRLLGVPMILVPVDVSSPSAIVPRSSFDECVEYIIEDLDYAIDNLPMVYRDAPASMENKPQYDEVYGVRYTNRMCGIVAKALKARLLYWAATPAYNPEGDTGRWGKAAACAAEVIDFFGGPEALQPDRIDYYNNEGSSDILWRKSIFNGHNWETDNFPPSLYGNGRINPTQNFVDAFPNAEGYPAFNPALPYENRDPRFYKYVTYNGSTFKTMVINTVNDKNDGLNNVAEKSTRTGYYLRKFMNPDVNLTTGSIVNARHFVTLLRYTEFFLIFAECAFEENGISDPGTYKYSSRSVLAALRRSAGLPAEDAYLNSITDPAAYRALIQNERRIELSFEGFRYWDIRRHLDYDAINATARGTDDGGTSFFDVEERTYAEHMVYGPIPYPEVQKGLEQNKGWK